MTKSSISPVCLAVIVLLIRLFHQELITNIDCNVQDQISRKQYYCTSSLNPWTEAFQLCDVGRSSHTLSVYKDRTPAYSTSEVTPNTNCWSQHSHTAWKRVLGFTRLYPMEIRQVLKSSASMIPVLFYKVSHGQRKPEGRGEGGAKGGSRDRNGEPGREEETIVGNTVKVEWNRFSQRHHNNP